MSSSSLSMHAAVYRKTGQPLRIETVMIAPVHDNEVRVKIKASAICHSDINFIDGKWTCDPPAIFGHEASGIVESIGKSVHHVCVGDHVIVTLMRQCGSCYYCRIGAGIKCQTAIKGNTKNPLTDSQGNPIVQGLKTAAFAEYVLVDMSQISVIDKSIPFDSAAVVACGGITGYGAVNNTAQITAGSDVIVIGAGGVGLNIVQAASLAGAKNIIVIDMQDNKRTIAQTFGATHFILANENDILQKINNITNKNGADYVFISVGAKKAIEEGLNYVTPLGTIVLVGMPGTGIRASFDPDTIADNNIRILGSKMGQAVIQRDIPLLIDFYKRKKILLDQLVSQRFHIRDINTALDISRQGKALRNVIMFDETI